MRLNNFQFQSKLPEVPTSIFSVMSALAHDQNALNLSQGFPHLERDKMIIK